MYSNEKKNGFSILDLLVKIIFAGIFIFILVWLFQKKIPNINMLPFYSNVFRENIKYMQDAGEGYFTNDKLPKTAGESVKLTLQEMENMNIILPFVDKDGKACNKNESYVSITKLENESGYELKTNLVCDTESHYTTKTLGCHVYCPNNGVTCNCNCNVGDNTEKCSYTKVTQYQFKKLNNGTKTTYSCDKGYSLKDKYCYKITLKDSKDANVTKTRQKTLTVDAKLVTGDSKLQQLTTLVSTSKQQLTTVVSTTPATTKQESYACTKTRIVNKCTDGTKQEAFACTKTRVVNKCTTEYKKEGYSCECATKFIGGKLKTTCNTCYRTVSYQSCKDVNEDYQDTCYRTVPTKSCKDVTEEYQDTCTRTVTIPGTTTYSCPSGTTSQVGSGANLKCYKNVTTYSCPSGTDTKEGSGANLKCYKVISGSTYYKCADSSYKLSGSKCTKVVTEDYTVKECPKGYKLEGNKCNLYNEQKVKAKSTTKKTTYYTYKWSESKSLSGWTSTGKTRTVNGKKVCSSNTSQK